MGGRIETIVNYYRKEIKTKKRKKERVISNKRKQNKASLKKIRERNSIRNQEINKTSRFSDDRLFLERNYRLIILSTLRILYQYDEAEVCMWVPHFSLKGAALDKFFS
jgi:hypothetical protein